MAGARPRAARRRHPYHPPHARCAARHAHTRGAFTQATRGQTVTRTTIHTDSAPQAIGTYSQAVRVGNTVYVSGQIPLDPRTGELVSGDIEVEIRRAFDN